MLRTLFFDRLNAIMPTGSCHVDYIATIDKANTNRSVSRRHALIDRVAPIFLRHNYNP